MTAAGAAGAPDPRVDGTGAARARLELAEFATGPGWLADGGRWEGRSGPACPWVGRNTAPRVGAGRRRRPRLRLDGRCAARAGGGRRVRRPGRRGLRRDVGWIHPRRTDRDAGRRSVV